MMTDIWSDDESEDDKGEMVFVYQNDVRELLDFVVDRVDLSTMTARQAEAWNALTEDACS